MHRILWPFFSRWFRHGASRRPGGLRVAAATALWALALVLLVGAGAARAEGGVNLTTFELARNDDGLQLTFSAKFELPKSVEDALQKGVPLVFVAEANVFRDRWYWRDKRVNDATRTWRLAYQPLTRKYRVTFGGLNQNHDNLADALASLSSSVNWKIAEPSQLEGDGYYVEFRYELDTSQMPRPMQIGIGGQADWSLRADRMRRLN